MLPLPLTRGAACGTPPTACSGFAVRCSNNASTARCVPHAARAVCGDRRDGRDDPGERIGPAIEIGLGRRRAQQCAQYGVGRVCLTDDDACRFSRARRIAPQRTCSTCSWSSRALPPPVGAFLRVTRPGGRSGCCRVGMIGSALSPSSCSPMWQGGAGQMPGVRTPVCVNQGSRGRRSQSTMGGARVRGDISIEQQQRARP